MKRKLWTVLAVMVILSLGLAACGPTPAPPTEAPPTEAPPTEAPPTEAPPPEVEKLTIAWIPKALNNPVFEVGRDGAFKKAEELTAAGPVEVEVLYVGSVASDMAEQARVVEDVIAKGVDAIGISCNDPTGCEDPINKAVEAGIPVMAWDSDSPDSQRFTYLGVDNYEGGKAAADLLVRFMGEEGKVALLTGVPGAFNLEERIRGFQDGVAGYSGIEIVSTVYCNDDINLGVQVVEETMQAHPDLDGWFFVGLWPLFADRGSMPLWEDAALNKGMANIVFDTLPVELEFLQDDYVHGLVGQKYWGWGYDTVQMIYDYIVQGTRYDDWTDSGMDIVTECNVDAMADMWATSDFTKPLPDAYECLAVAEAPAAPPAEVEPLIIGTTDTVTDLDPGETYDFHTWEIFYNVAGGLLNYIPGTTDLEPQLAAEWPTVSDDGLEWTFKLLPDMVFPDGTPVDAHAVKWSLDRVVRLEGDPNWLVSSFLEEVIVVDDLTVTIKLQNPVGFFPYLTAITPWYPVSPNCYSEDGFDSDSTCSGLGPYKITRWERDVEMELEANPDYPRNPPKWPRIIVRYFADATTMRLALENGEIDVAWKTLLPTDYVDLEDNPDVVVIEGPGAYIRYICFNATTPPFDNIKVKQAISLAIDRDEISDRVYLGTHQPLYSMVPMGMKGHIDAFSERDLEAAKALLAEAGYSEASPLEMDLWWTTAHYGDTEADVATVMKANLEETGMIKVSLQSAEWATYTDYFGPGTMPVFLLGWYPDYLDPDNYTWSFAHSEAADDLGIFYASEEMDALLEEAQTETDMEARMDLYAQIQELWTTEVPTAPFTQGSLYAVTQKNVSGITLAPNMYLPYFLLEK